MSQVLTVTHAIRLNKYVICGLVYAQSLATHVGSELSLRHQNNAHFLSILKLRCKYPPPTWNKIIFISKVNRPPTAAAKSIVISLHLTKVADSPAVLVRTPIMTNMDICTAQCRWHLEPGPCP